MQRRDFVRGVIAAGVAVKAAVGQQTSTPVAQKLPPAAPKAPGPVPWSRGLLEVKPLPMTPLVADAVAKTDSSFLSATQMATLERLGELFMPARKGKPGAKEAATAEFLDFLIGASGKDKQHMYTSGLDRLESEAKQKFGAGFAGITAAQADELIKPWLRAWMNEHPPVEEYALFINIVHSDIRTATMNSQAWADAAKAAGQAAPDIDLYWYPVDPILRGDDKAGRAN